MSVKGIIERIDTRNVTTKFGSKPTYNVIVGGVGYSSGFTKPIAGPGQEVQFEFTSGKYGNEIIKGSMSTTGGSSSPIATPSSAAKEEAPATVKGQFYKPFPIPPLHGDRAIVRQNALTNARELVVSTLDTTYLTEDRLLEVVKTILKVAPLFEAYSCGDTERLAVDEEVLKDKTAEALAAVAGSPSKKRVVRAAEDQEAA